MHEMTGSCHCGGLSYRLAVPVPVLSLPARSCQCDYCARVDALWTSHPEGILDVRVASPESLIRYRFGTGTAEFLVCGRCGILAAAVSRIDGRDYAVVNLRSASVSVTDRDRTPTDFGGEDTAGRLARRRRNWIPTVRIRHGDVS